MKQLLLLLFFFSVLGQIRAQPETFFSNPANIEFGNFGASVSINEEYAVVGSLNNQNEMDGDTIFFPVSVYKKDEAGAWGFQTALVPDDYYSGQEVFGWRVSISDENVIVVTNFTHLNVGDDYPTGAIYVFELQAGVWTQTGNIPNPRPENEGYFAYNIDVDGDYIIASNAFYYDEEHFTSMGAAFIYHKQDGQWLLEASLFPTPSAPMTLYGLDVAISGEYAMVSEFRNESDFINRVHVYKKTDGIWQEEGILTSEPENNELFYGYSIAMEDSVAVIGATVSNTNTDTSDLKAFVEVLQLTESGWQHGQKLWSESERLDDHFGEDIDLNDDKIIIGAYNNQVDDEQLGLAYLFQKAEDDWQLVKAIQPEEIIGNSAFAVSVSLSKGDALVSDPNWKNTSGQVVGGVYFFDLAEFNVATNFPTAKDVALTLSPNPASHYLNISLQNQSSSLSSEVNIYNVLGHLVLQQPCQKGIMSMAIDVSSIRAGLYFCEVEVSGERVVRTFVKVSTR